MNACNDAWKLSVAQRKSVIMKSIQDGRIPVMQTLRTCLKKYDEIREKYEVSIEHHCCLLITKNLSV